MIDSFKLSECKTILPTIISIDSNEIDFKWTEKQWYESLLSNSELRLIISRHDETSQITGFALILCSEIERLQHILKIAVVKKYRNSGVGSHLLEKAILDRPNWSLYLEVASSNTTAIEFYKKLKFKVISVKKHFYSNGENAFVMMRTPS